MMPGFLPFVGRAGSAGVLCVSVCLAACQLNKDLDGYAHGGDATVGDADLGDGLVSADAHDDVPADQGPEAGVVYEPCGNGTVRCAAGVLQDLCSNGKWRVIKNCAGSGMLCNALGKTCVPKCKEDRDCKDSDRETGEFCRGDGRCASKVFETVWEVDGSDRSITLPFYNDGTRDLKCVLRCFGEMKVSVQTFDTAALS